MGAPNLWVTLGLKSAAFDRGMDKSGRKIGGLRKSAKGLGVSLKELGRAAGIAVGAYGLGRLAAGMVRTASLAEETEAKFNTVFRGMATETKAWAVSFGDDVGRATHEIQGWMAGLQDTFVPLGIARDEAADLSKSLVKLAVDVASFNNQADADVIRDFTSALVGNHETVRKYGIIIGQSALAQEALNSGLTKGYSKLSDLEKVQLRYNLIQKGTTDAQGDALRTADSYANQMKRLKANWSELQVSMGTVILSPLADFVKDVNWLLTVGLPSLTTKYDSLQRRSRGTLPEMELGRDTGAGVEEFNPPWVQKLRREKAIAEAKAAPVVRQDPLANYRGRGLMPPEQRRMGTDDFDVQRRMYEKHSARFRAKEHERNINKQLNDLARIEKANRESAERVTQAWEYVGQSMGYSMSNAAEDMIFENKKASEAIRDIARDLARDVMRQFIFQPFTQGMGNWFGSLFSQGHSGGDIGSMSGVRDLSTSPMRSDERLVVGQVGEHIGRPSAAGGGRGPNVSVQNNVQLINNSSHAIQARIADVWQDAKQTVTEIIFEDVLDGGPISQMVGVAG